jgi:nucleotide-binding universal stress UspA family protein
MTIDRILVAVSFSERSVEAVRKAADLAAEHGSNITLLHVVEPAKRRSVRSLPAQHTLLRARVTHARHELARHAGEIAARNRLSVDFRVEIGEKVASILRACADADLLFIGGATLSGLAAALHMTTVERLIGKCAIPVLVANGPRRRRYARALVPADGTYRSTAAVSAAARFWPDAELTLLHAMDGRQEQLMRLHDLPFQRIWERHALRTARGLVYLKALASRARVATTRVAFRLAFGDAWRAVVSIQDEVDAQVVVLTKRKGALLADFILGSTVRRVLAGLRCDVLVTPATPGRHLSARRFALIASP